MSAAAVIALVLAIALAVALVGLRVVAVQYAAQRVRADGLQRELQEIRDELARREGRRTQLPAERAVRTLVGTASRLREQGVQGFVASSLEDLASWAADDSNAIAQAAGPDGKVTILFTDIKNSTALNADLGDRAWVLLLGAHDKVVRSRVTRHGGTIVKSQGDGFMVAFPRADDAVHAALSIQRGIEARRGLLWLQPIEVRIGMHAGVVVTRDGDLFGRTVATAARVAAVADGGETVISQEVYDAVRDEGLDFADLGEREFKGLPGQHRLWRVARPRRPRRRTS